MSIRTTVTLDDDVHERVKHESRKRGQPFRQVLNELLRMALLAEPCRRRRKAFRVKAYNMGYRPGLPYDSTSALIEYAEGPGHR